MPDYMGMSPHRIEVLFERYQRLDAEELRAAAPAVHMRADAVQRAFESGKWKDDPKREPPSEAEYDRTMVESAAAAWAETLARAREADRTDIVGFALRRAMDGDAHEFVEAMKKAQAITFSEVEAQIASVNNVKRDLSRAGMATFLLADGENPLAEAAKHVSAVVDALDTVLRAELARRISAADAGEETKSSRNRARRSREWDAAIPVAQERYRKASSSLPGNAWAQGEGRAARADPQRTKADANARPAKESGIEPPAATEESTRAGGSRPQHRAEKEGPSKPRRDTRTTRDPAPNAKRKVGITFPPGCAQPPFVVTGKDGRKWMKSTVRMPGGTVLGGQPLDGYSVSLFCRDFHADAIAKGQRVTFRLDEDMELTLFADGKPEIECGPWELTRAVKAAREKAPSPSPANAVRAASPAHDAARAREAARERKAEPQRREPGRS